MAPTRGRLRLTPNKKYEILQEIDKGESHRSIAKRYGVGHVTVSKINADREKIKKFLKVNAATTSSSTVVMKSPYVHVDLNRHLRQWCIECTVNGIDITGPMIQEKAKELNTKLKGGCTFTACLRWVSRFRQRHNLRKADVDKDLEIPNEVTAHMFKTEFNELMQKEGYRLENVYNAATTGLLWKAAPEITLLSELLEEFEETKGKSQITTFLCANATGCHKLPVLIIGTTRDPPSIMNTCARTVPIMYKINTKPYIDSNIFNEWFNECFLKSVTERQQKDGHREKTLLLLNNAGLDLENTIINTKDEFVKIMYFSYDVAPVIQPMDRGIIACFKRMYRHELLDLLIITPNRLSEDELVRVYSNLKMEDCCFMVYNAWLTVKNPILKNAWDKLLKDESEQSSEESEITIKEDIDEALEKLNRLPGCGDCDSVAVMNWFQIDKKHTIGMQIDINQTLIDFIDVAMDTEADKLSDEDLEDISDDSSVEMT